MFRYVQEQLKTLTSCDQKVSDLGAIVITSVARRQGITGIQTASKWLIKIFMWNVAMSYSPTFVEKAARKGCRWLCENEDGGTSKWHSVMECIRVQTLPGTKVSRRPILVLCCVKVCIIGFKKESKWRPCSWCAFWHLSMHLSNASK